MNAVSVGFQDNPAIRHRSENECRDVAVLRLYKVSGQRIFQFGRCLLFIFRAALPTCSMHP
jgi:hypothetical protein